MKQQTNEFKAGVDYILTKIESTNPDLANELNKLANKYREMKLDKL